ncbi:YjbF family lipoprotein [Pseudidiomarina insulisalsae]|uniref:YjbF family lipoprotein n=1 Tax=Pseudidiomarina insulisalsae TaxID=575789 RepID=A0A432YNX2_9GAMM|nr:YjbF family lipoprotein [Pseudidiomarina insulisalsae]RUO62592.1 hypothetical protein CWI71_03945 [Pseudidiomarina insulisalsae]
MASTSRILLLGALSVLVLSGCSARVQNMVDTARTAVFGHDGVELTTEQVNKYPYAAAYIKTERFPQAVAVLDRTSDQQRVYRTGGDEALTTRFGRVLTSSGIPGMPLYTLNWQADPLACYVQQLHRGTKQRCPDSWERQVETGNYGENDLQRVTFNSSFNVSEQRSYLHPDGTELTITVIREVGAAGDQSFENTFYAANGRVVYAQQWVSDAIGYVTWREMKPFSGDLP